MLLSSFYEWKVDFPKSWFHGGCLRRSESQDAAARSTSLTCLSSPPTLSCCTSRLSEARATSGTSGILPPNFTHSFSLLIFLSLHFYHRLLSRPFPLEKVGRIDHEVRAIWSEAAAQFLTLKALFSDSLSLKTKAGVRGFERRLLTFEGLEPRQTRRVLQK